MLLDSPVKVDLLGIGVHPDDVELGCIGTLMKHQRNGKTFGIVDLTGGELGTRGDKHTRLKEANESAKISKATFRTNLHYRDGFFTINEKTLLPLISAIRSSRPDIVLGNATRDRHPDHGRASTLISEACFLSGLIKIKTLDSEGNSQEAWRPKRVYHYVQDYSPIPDFAIDITRTMDDKIATIMAFKSQFFNPDSNEPQTPISSQDFIQFVEGKARVYGRQIEATFAEGFTVDSYLKVNDLYHTI